MLSFLLGQSRKVLTLAILAGLISGICSVLLLTQINEGLTSPDISSGLMWRFGLLAVAAMLTRMVASVLFESLSHSSQASVRKYVSKKVLTTGYQQIEQIGSARIQSALTDHGNNVAQFFIAVPLIATNGMIVIGCLAYMAYLSLTVFLMALGSIGLGALSYHLAHLKSLRFLEAASKEQDNLFRGFRSLVAGAKELKLNATRRDNFYRGELEKSIDEVKNQRTKGMSIFVLAASWGSFLVYAFIGLVLFVLVGDSPNRTEVMTGYALIFVYMITPLEVVLFNLPKANLAKVSANKIDEITESLQEETQVSGKLDNQSFSGLALTDIGHSYYHEVSDDMFTLGPVSLNFKPGQISFLVGGNGSGKTTLAKLIAGLYVPESGHLSLNNRQVKADGFDEYRQIFSSVFSDFHLFESLLDVPSAELDQRGNALLAKLHLSNKVRVENGVFTTRALSQGQRKRLALVSVYLEQRPFLIFDEWAADQDPVFKQVFYCEVLPELRAAGKCVLVISHDDRYFNQADQLIRIEEGKIQSVTPGHTGLQPQGNERNKATAPTIVADSNAAALV